MAASSFPAARLACSTGGPLTRVLFVVIALSSRVARAEPQGPLPRAATGPSVALEWDGAARGSGCVGADSLAAAVEHYLGRPVFTRGPADSVVRVHAEPASAGTYRALIELSRGPSGTAMGERELVVDGTSCAALTDPLVLAIALLVDGAVVQAHRDSVEEPAKERPSPARVPPYRLALSLLGQGATLPKPGPGGELALSRTLIGQLSARGELGMFLPVAADLAPPAQAELGFGFAGAGLCEALPLPVRVDLSVCGAALGALTYASTAGIRGGTRHSALVFGAELALEGSAPLSRRLFLTASLRGRLLPRAPRFVVRSGDTTENVFQFRNIDGLVSLGLGVRL